MRTVSIIVAVVAFALIVGGFFWLGDRSPYTPDDGGPEVIAAPPGDYKVKPSDPGGMKVEGEGDTAFSASEGAEPKGYVDDDAIPEAPVNAAKKAVEGGNTTGASLEAPPEPSAPAKDPNEIVNCKRMLRQMTRRECAHYERVWNELAHGTGGVAAPDRMIRGETSTVSFAVVAEPHQSSLVEDTLGEKPTQMMAVRVGSNGTHRRRLRDLTDRAAAEGPELHSGRAVGVEGQSPESTSAQAEDPHLRPCTGSGGRAVAAVEDAGDPGTRARHSRTNGW